MTGIIETVKRKITCDPKIDKSCKCKDHTEIGHENGKPTYLKKRVCEKDIN